MRLIRYNLPMLDLYPKMNNLDLVVDLLMSVFRVTVSRFLLRQYPVCLYEPNALILVHHNIFGSGPDPYTSEKAPVTSCISSVTSLMPNLRGETGNTYF